MPLWWYIKLVLCLNVLACFERVGLSGSPSGMMAFWNVWAIIAAILSSMDVTEVALCPPPVALTSLLCSAIQFFFPFTSRSIHFFQQWNISYCRWQSLHSDCLSWTLLFWDKPLMSVPDVAYGLRGLKLIVSVVFLSCLSCLFWW